MSECIVKQVVSVPESQEETVEGLSCFRRSGA